MIQLCFLALSFLVSFTVSLEISFLFLLSLPFHFHLGDLTDFLDSVLDDHSDEEVGDLGVLL